MFGFNCLKYLLFLEADNPVFLFRNRLTRFITINILVDSTVSLYSQAAESFHYTTIEN